MLSVVWIVSAVSFLTVQEGIKWLRKVDMLEGLYVSQKTQLENASHERIYQSPNH